MSKDSERAKRVADMSLSEEQRGIIESFLLLPLNHTPEEFSESIVKHATKSQNAQETKKILEGIKSGLKKKNIDKEFVEAMDPAFAIIDPQIITMPAKLIKSELLDAVATKAKAATEKAEAQAKKEAEDRIRDLNSIKLGTIISDSETYTPLSDQYKEDKELTKERSPRMETLLEIEERVGKITTTGKATRDDKKFLKAKIQTLLKNEPENVRNLVNKHMGSLLRKELKNPDIKVERTWGQFFADNFRNNDKAHKKLKESAFDVESLVVSMKNHASDKAKTEQKPPAQRPKSEGRGV